MSDNIRILFFGDIVGPLGRKAVKKYISLHKESDQIDFIIANGENTTHGHGLSYPHYKELLSYGIDCLTSGNHFFNSPDAIKCAKDMPLQIRPYNFDPSCPGKGTDIFEAKDGTKIRITSMIGRTYLGLAQSNPFYDMDKIINENDQNTIHILDFHAEATGEKRLMAEYIDGKITAVLGTHTHVQTNDAKILPKGTFFMTDVGMNGAYYSSLGDEIGPALHRTLTGMPATFEVPRSGKMLVNAVMFDVDKNTHQVKNYKVINETYQDDSN